MKVTTRNSGIAVQRPQLGRTAAGVLPALVVSAIAFLATSAPSIAAGPPSIAELSAKAESGDIKAAFELAMRLDYGKEVVQDRSGAGKWYLMAAEGGMAEAQNSLGSLYEAGEGVVQDYSQALFWYQKAAEQFHPEALNNLARLYDEGKGVVEDNPRAMDLYTKAAEHGFVSSMVNLSIMYRDGEGTPTDLREAYKWIELGRFYTQRAKDRQLKWRIRGLQEALKARMTSDDIRVATARARQWQEALK